MMGAMITRREFIGGSVALGIAVALGRRDVARYFGSPASTPNLRTLTSAPEGGWSWFEDPRAVAQGAYTYVGYIDSSGNVKVDVSLAGVHVATRTLHAALEIDDHDPPTLHVRTDGKLATYYSKHLGPNIYQRISNNTLTSDPTISGGFASATSLSAGFSAALSTYPSPLPLSNIDGAGPGVFLLWREHSGGVPYLWYARSNDDGDTFGSAVHLHDITYSKAAANGTGRLDMACSEHPNGSTGDATKIYHLYRESNAWKKSDGTTIAAALPMAGSDMTEVYDAGTDPLWVSDIAIGAGGNPVIAFVTWPAGDTSDARYMYARWTGAAWSVTQICAAGGYLPDAAVGGNPIEAYYAGGVILDSADPQIVYASREVSGQWEMFRYVTANGGTSFTSTQLTTSSAGKNFRPVSVRNPADVTVVWLNGTYHSYVDYSVGIKGYIP